MGEIRFSRFIEKRVWNLTIYDNLDCFHFSNKLKALLLSLKKYAPKDSTDPYSEQILKPMYTLYDKYSIKVTDEAGNTKNASVKVNILNNAPVIELKQSEVNVYK